MPVIPPAVLVLAPSKCICDQGQFGDESGEQDGRGNGLAVGRGPAFVGRSSNWCALKGPDRSQKVVEGGEDSGRSCQES